uniref:T9SS type B sorting domain-containing protein n=1 Tax=uncultured Marivirga sp. TaxID=1123707 RepID=UPI0030ECC2A6
PNAGVFTGTNGAACNDSAFDLTTLLDGSQDAGGSWSDDDTSGATITGNTGDFAGVASGTYNFTYIVNGSGSCTNATETITVDVGSLEIDDVVTQPASCGAEGTVELNVLNGSADLVKWTDENDNDVTGTDPLSFSATAGTYTLLVNDNTTNCQFTKTYNLVDPAPFTVDAVVSNQTECNLDNGSIDITINSGSGSETFQWTGPGIDASNENNEDQQDLTPGDYSVVVTDNGCTVTENYTVDPVESISATLSSELASCGSSDGTISVRVAQIGSNTYDVVLKDSSGEVLIDSLGIDVANDSVVFAGLFQASYRVIVTDNVTACSDSLNIVVNEDAPFIPNVSSVTNIQNCGDLGSISITFADANEPTSYAWVNEAGDPVGNDSPDLNGVEAGLYTVTLSDANCTVVISDIEITQPAECDYDCEDFRVTPITEAATCLGVDDGKMFFLLRDVNESSPELNFDIKPTGTDDSLYHRFTVTNIGQGLIVEIDTTFATGSYTVVASDPNLDCTADTVNINIGTKTTLSATIDIEQPTCTISTGSISASIAGTTDSFKYILYFDGDSLTSNMTGVFADLEEGDYEIEFNNQSANSCGLSNRTFTIENTAVVDQSAVDINVSNPDCGEVFGSIAVSLNNLPSNYEFILVDGNDEEVARNSTGIFNDVAEGTYVVQFENVVDPGACPIADRGGIVIENDGSFSAVASEVENIVCFGDNTGSAIITLEGISTGFYSLDNGQLWTEFTSGNRISGLPAVNNLLVSDEPGTSDCELSVAVGIEYLSQPITLDGSIELITQASCTVSEQVGEINVPAVSGGVAPYEFSIDGKVVELDADRNIGGLARNVNQLTITDDTGCSENFDIRSIVSPNEVRAVVTEINPNNNCTDDPEGILVVIDEATIDNVPGPYNLILNRVNETTTSEYVLDINTNGSREFLISQFNIDENIPFIKGARYRWTVRAVDNDQACSADNFVTINGGAIIPTFDIEASDVACFQESGSIELFNIIADETIQLFIEVYEGNDVDPTETFTLNSIPESRRFVIDQSIYGMMTRGDYIVKLSQQPSNCSSTIESENASVFIDAPVAQLNVELVPEPNLPPGIERERTDMNPMPTTRPDRANGSISIRLVEPISGANGYSAQIFLLTPLGGNNSSDYVIPTEPIEFDADRTITFANLLPGIYEIEYYDSFGCGLDGNRLVFDGEGSSDITVDFDRSPFIPNVFTPNNDGKNDEFRILNLPDNGAELIVTNRTGTIVYRDSNYRSSNLWDGGDNPDGIYFYQLTVDGNVQSGWVEIIRGKR